MRTSVGLVARLRSGEESFACSDRFDLRYKMWNNEVKCGECVKQSGPTLNAEGELLWIPISPTMKKTSTMGTKTA